MAFTKINQNVLAKRISETEGKLKEVNIGQIKEVQKVLLRILATEYDRSQVLFLLEEAEQACEW